MYISGHHIPICSLECSLMYIEKCSCTSKMLMYTTKNCPIKFLFNTGLCTSTNLCTLKCSLNVHQMGDLSNNGQDKFSNEFVVHKMRNLVYIRSVIYPMRDWEVNQSTHLWNETNFLWHFFTWTVFLWKSY